MEPTDLQAPPIRFVSVICWDASFRENFDAVGCLLSQTVPKDRYELIFVEYYEEANPEVLALAEQHENMQMAALGNPHPGKENEHSIGACVNEGLRRARGDLIVIPDADVMFEEDFLEEVVRQHERYEELALYFYRMDEPATDRPLPRTLRALKRVCELPNPGNYGGCLTVRKKWLVEINGYDEGPLFRGYSGVDVDTASRLRSLGLAIRWHPRKFIYHGHHPGARKPPPENFARMEYALNRAVRRMRTREVLPARGLDPDLHPESALGSDEGRQPAKPTVRSGSGGRLARLVRRMLPAGLRTRLIAILRD